jgi:hypothetical protein
MAELFLNCGSNHFEVIDTSRLTPARSPDLRLKSKTFAPPAWE